MSEALPTIDFRRIRMCDGTQHAGFEQLAVELFARKHNLSRQLVRVNGAGGDGGVEAFASVAGLGKVGMQSKYFDRLGEAQWKQIDKSVRRAMEEHPDLKEYWIFVPLDRTLGQGKRKGQLEKWKQYEKSWSDYSRSSEIRFVWQGRHEIGVDLKSTQNHDLIFYWFGTPQFSDVWMGQLLDASLRTLGERYQPGRHVDASVVRDLERFTWSPAFTRDMENAYISVAESCIDFSHGIHDLPLPAESEKEREAARSAVDEVVRHEYPEYAIRRVDQARQPARLLLGRLDKLEQCLQSQPSGADGLGKERLEFIIHSVNKFSRKASEWYNLLDRASDADCQCMLVKGEAGSGKSHLLAHAAVQAARRQQPVILALGEQFLTGRPPLVQLCEMVGWNGGQESLLGALNTAASLAKRPALLLIDALNESGVRRLWKTSLHTLAAALKPYPYVRLIVSCRSDFVGITMPGDFKSGVPDGWGLIRHEGFGDVLVDAVARYFECYNIQSPHFPPLLDEFRNPLFLDTFCRAFENDVLPSGPITLRTVMERRITRLAEKVQDDIDCDEHHVRQAIQALAEKIRDNGGLAVEESEARSVIEPHSPSAESSRSLYTHLLSGGVIVKRVDRWWEENSPVVVRFAFERFSDYFIAQSLLENVADTADMRGLLSKVGKCSWLQDSEAYLDNRGVARAFAVLVPERYGVELIELLPEIDHRGDVLSDLLDSLPWRSGASIRESTKELVLEASQYEPISVFIESLLRMSTIPEHPLNASFLHDRLAAMSLPRRDKVWTIPVSRLAASESAVARVLVEWAIRVPRTLVSEEQAALVATVLLWFGSSNSVGFRARAGHAAIRILVGRPHVVNKLVNEFDSVNDPYVVERLYAVACGVAMREPAGDGLETLAATVHRLVFATENVRPHILLRDYAQTLLATAEHRGCLGPDIHPDSFRPPFASKMPRIIGEARAQQIEGDASWREIVSSVKPEGMGWYGDFGRYVMGSAIHHFLAIKKNRPIPPESSFRNWFEGKRARRWVLQAVQSLGWDGNLFKEYDASRHDLRMMDREHKVERIGKKYQWIALYELLGYLSDHYHMRPGWGDRSELYRGAWQIDARDFDPSAEPRHNTDLLEDEDADSQPSGDLLSEEWAYLEPYPDLFGDGGLLADRAAWVRTIPSDPACLLMVNRPGDSQRALVLNGFWKWNEPRILRLRHGWDGRCEMWLHMRSWMVKKEDARAFVRRMRRINFWGNGCHCVSLRDSWIGEYPHGASIDVSRQWCAESDEWTKNDASLHIRTTCEWDRRGGVMVPSPQLCDLLELSWAGYGAAFVDRTGTIVATAARVPHVSGTPPCVVLESTLRAGLDRAGLQIVWATVGERRCWNGERMVGDVIQRFNCVHTLSEDGIAGGLTVVENVDVPD